jgi:alpha-2-macroglobulin
MTQRALTFVLFIAACGGSKTSAPTSGSGSATAPGQTNDTPGLELRLSTGKLGAPAYDHAKLAPATKLPDADVTALFDRLGRAHPLEADAADKQAFALRPKSQPPPKTGTTIQGAFPPPPSSLAPPKTDSGALQVLRWMPEGAVPVAPELSVTFSQPMVAVTSQTDASATTPVKLSPPTKGHWRWIGTRTIMFSPDVRFPQATTYTVEIPAGTKSATGGVLAKGVKFSFETPPPTVVSSYPSSGAPQHTDVPMFVLFDQKVDAHAVLGNVHVTADGKAVQVESLDQAAIAKLTDKQVQNLVDAAAKNGQEGRWIAFRAAGKLPTDAAISVEIAAGTPSAEGPNKTKAPQRFAFKTYPKLKVVRSDCGYGSECRPGMPFVIEFNNPLDAERFDDKQVTVSPDVPGVKLVPSWQSLMVQGSTKARTMYKVTLAAGLTDQFGQTLGADETVTFRVGDAVPTFWGPEGLVVLDPAASKPTVDFFTTNYEQLKVRLYQVEPGDYDAFLHYEQNRWNHDHPPSVPGKKVFDGAVPTKPGSNQLVETAVDLSAVVGKGGHAIVIVEPFPYKESGPVPQRVAWVQATKLAVDAHVDADRLVAFATDLATGKPAPNVALETRPFGITATTDDSGLASLPLAAASGRDKMHYLVARRGGDVAFVVDSSGITWSKQPRNRELAWYVIDDRKMYRPGEEVSLKGWIRGIDQFVNGDIGWNGDVTSVRYKVNDAEGNQIATGTAQVSAVGGFDTKFTLPKTPNLGSAEIIFEAQGRLKGTYEHSIEVEEFRRPDFEVSAQASQGPFVVGGAGDITVNAKYFAGGPLAGAPVNWLVTANQTSYTPPNRDDYIFGAWRPWWGERSFDDEGEFVRPGRAPKPPYTLASTTDASGAHTLHLDFVRVNPAMPMSVTANATVTDVNRQAWTASSAIIVHPADLYVGLKTQKPFVDKGQPFAIDTIGVDLDGKLVPGAKIELRAARLDWEYKKGKYETKEVDVQTQDVVSGSDPKTVQLATKEGGTYQVTATIHDAKGRANQTTLTFWVTGGEMVPARNVSQEKVQIIPDKKDYAPGTTAQLLVQAPFYPAEGLVSWRRSGIVKIERITFDGPTKIVSVPITDAMTPNLYIQVDLVGAAPRTDDHGAPDPKLPKRPAYAVGSIDLPVPPKQRTLSVAVVPAAAKVAPAAKTSLAIEVKDAAGQAVPNAEVAVIVVDEAILSLTGYQFPTPIDSFYGQRSADVRDSYIRAYLRLAKLPAGSPPPPPKGGADGIEGGVMGGEFKGDNAPADKFAERRVMANAAAPEKPMAKAEKKRALEGKEQPEDEETTRSPGQPKAIAIRSNFNPLAAFAPAVKTGADGKATVEVKIPDSLTRYRIVAIAASDTRRFGKGESAITARLPLMVRASPPRFLNFGDKLRLPVVVQNQTDAAMTVKVAVRTTNLAITDGAGRQLTVPPNDRVEVQFPAAAEMAGTARLQVVGAAGDLGDAQELSLPVWTPATTEAFATYGVIDDGAIRQPVALPGNVVTQFGGLEITTSSTNLAALTDALLYLVRYPFECAEQRSSRVLAIAELKDVLAAFKATGLPAPAAMNASVSSDVEHLSQMQNDDGGFAFWDRGFPSEPYLSVYVTNALVRAKAKGFAVPQPLLDRAKKYLREIEAHYPSFYGPEIRRTISAFALYTRKLMGDVDLAKGKQLLRDAGGPDKLSMEADGWLLGTFAGNAAAADERQTILRHAMNKVSETAGAANFTTSYGDGAYLILASDRRVDGVMLESLIQEAPTSDLIPKLVTGLLAHRKAGHWLNTQENAFVLAALDLYFHTFEKTTPDFVARVWLGDDYAGDKAFRGRTTEQFRIDIPMKDVATHDKSDLVIQKDGKGRLYYRVGMTYAPASLKLDAADYGFVVERNYEAVDDPKDVTRAQDGSWHVKAGARVRVRLKMVNDNRRYHVALVDPLPAGLEPMNPALAVTGPIPEDPKDQQSRGAYWWWYGPWYEHQNMRDERVEAFAAQLWEGVHDYSYVARATTPGNFVVPPPKAEEMYMPETFGRGASDRLIVE